MRSDLFANVEQQASEPGFRLQNGKLLKATINGGSFFARRGSMVAYQGAARFEYQGALSGDGSMKDKLLKAAKGAISGEGVPLMKVSGQAEVFLAEQAADIFLIDLDGADALSINGANVLAFESTLGSVLLCHGLGSDDMARVGIDDYGYALEANDALQGLRASSHELVLCGHTHHAHLHTFAELRLLNAGTLVRDQHPCFVLLDFDAPNAGIYDLGATTSPRTQHAL